MVTPQTLWRDIDAIRQQAPLVHNITNFVVMNSTANALLSLGASPVMAHAAEEVEEMVGLASALVVNIGTLSQTWIDSMAQAIPAAAARQIPIVFDPVGAGATRFRTESCLRLMGLAQPSVIRGNASEIMALAGAQAQTRGVDSVAGVDAAQSAARQLAQHWQCVVVVSGASDLITDGETQVWVDNGHAMMPRVTGLGCTASALVGAFCAVNYQPLQASAHAMVTLGICGELAAEVSAGPGSLQLAILDALYGLELAEVGPRVRVRQDAMSCP
nr:hydroxyethylthiazole kinase [uncultured Desulfuromonas sp.]